MIKGYNSKANQYKGVHKMISKTWQGYEISKSVRGSRFPVYVKSIYKGKVKWTTDYTHAKHYTEATAKKLDKQIDEDIRAGKLAHMDILSDGEAQPEVEPVKESLAEEFANKAKSINCREFFWNDDVMVIDEAMSHMLDCIAICSNSEYESDLIALEYYKKEYIRLAEVRADAVKEWFAVW